MILSPGDGCKGQQNQASRYSGQDEVTQNECSYAQSSRQRIKEKSVDGDTSLEGEIHLWRRRYLMARGASGRVASHSRTSCRAHGVDHDLADPADSERTFEARLNFTMMTTPFSSVSALFIVWLPFLPKRSLSLLLNPSNWHCLPRS